MTCPEFSETQAILYCSEFKLLANDEHLSFNINQVPAAPPPIPVDYESEISDFSESEEELEPVEENRLRPCYDPRYCELPSCTDLRHRCAGFIENIAVWSIILLSSQVSRKGIS